MRRFFAAISGERAEITGEDAHHIANVLRLQTEEKIIACDGNGLDFITELEYISAQRVLGRIIKSMPSEGEPKVKITVFQGLPKADKLEYIIQKAVELGAYSIVPVETKRAVVKIEENKKQAKTERWNKISVSAAKQSGRGIIPEVLSPVSLQKATEMMKSFDLKIAAYEEEKSFTLKDALNSCPNAKTIAVFIGPEGGIDSDEISLLKSSGANVVTLGSRILRCETAPVAVLSMIMYHYM